MSAFLPTFRYAFVDCTQIVVTKSVYTYFVAFVIGLGSNQFSKVIEVFNVHIADTVC